MPHVCPWYLAYFFDNPFRRLFMKPEQLFAPYVRPGMAALDIGCGMGYNSIGLARLVAPEGRVIAVDLQQRMLNVLMKRARRAGVAGYVEPHVCDPGDIGINTPVDFACAFWVAHETPDAAALLRQIRAVLRPGGHAFLAEPRGEVTETGFARLLEMAGETGFDVVDRPHVAFSRAAVLRTA